MTVFAIIGAKVSSALSKFQNALHRSLIELAKATTSAEAMASYLKARAGEPSTWLGISAAVGGASAFGPPYSWLCIACGVIAVLIPSHHG